MKYEQTSRLHRPERRQFLLTGLGLAAAASLSGCFDDDKIDLADQKLITLDGKAVHLSTLKGQPSAIAFWATTCPGCIEEIPHIVALHEKFTPRGANIVGISMDYDPIDQVRNMVEARAIPYTIWSDQQGEASKAFGGVRLTPTFFVLDADARIRYQRIGEFDTERVDRLLERLTS